MKFNIRNTRHLRIYAVLFVFFCVIVIYFMFKAERQEISYMELLERLEEARSLEDENRIEEALVVYNKVLKFTSENWYAEEYARTKHSIGIAYSHLAGVKDSRSNLKKAIKAYKDALKVFTLELYPGQYANVQNSLGNTYWKFGRSVKNLTKEIKARKEALKGYNIVRDTSMCAYNQWKLGDNYFKLAKFQDEQENLKEAIRYYEGALKVYTQEKYPSDYESIRTMIVTAKGWLK